MSEMFFKIVAQGSHESDVQEGTSAGHNKLHTSMITSNAFLQYMHSHVKKKKPGFNADTS